MASNGLNYNQVSAVMNEVYKIATGQEGNIANIAGGDVVSVAQKTLLTGYDNFINAISQVLSKTIFSARRYDRKFRGLMADSIRYGNHVRKITPLNKTMVNDSGLPLEDNGSVDPFKISKHKAVQFNFYGQNGYEYHDTRPDWQLDNAVRDAGELGSLFTSMMVDANNTIEKYHEETARFTLSNLIVGTCVSRANDVIHLLSEYKTETGLELTAEDVKKPENYPAFIKWVYARVASISDKMTEFSINYHTNVEDGTIMRHTPQRMQKFYLYAPYMHEITARVLADTFHDNFLRFADTERVNFWQDIDNPDVISLKPTYLAANGSLVTPESAETVNNVFGVIFDEEAAGYTVINNRVKTVYNARGEYTNIFYKFTDRYWNDFTENCVVLLLD